jgi:16S rRNA (uracil1498-N3)-methyltransferase
VATPADPSMTSRFYVPELRAGARARLSADEAHHLARVLRLKIGDQVTVFDGRGHEADARIERVEGQTVELAVGGRLVTADESQPPVTLAVAVPKADRFAWLVEKATELGVARLVPLLTARSVVHPGASKLEKLRRTIVEASKQCGRSWLMTLHEPIPWREFVLREFTSGLPLIADPSGEPLAEALEADRPLLLAVGPEGGFTAEEREEAREQGGRLVSLGPWMLRIETAAIALAALALARRNDPH